MMPIPNMDEDRMKVLKQIRAFLGLGSYNRRYVKKNLK